MRITPLDIKEKQFPVMSRGFDVEEVDAFLEAVKEEMEDLTRENAALKEQLHRYKDLSKGDIAATLLEESLATTQKMLKAYIANFSEETELLLKKLEKQRP